MSENTFDDDEVARRPTMHDVAARAGVALSSVSRALSDHPDVSKKMRRRVHEAARELGYEPNFLAQSLRTGSTYTIGFLIRDIANPFFAAMANGAEHFLRQRGFVMLLVNSDGDSDVEANHISVLRRRRVDGLILNLVTEDHEPTVAALGNLETPFVLVDRTVPGTNASAVLCDHYTGVRTATDDLIAHGHRRIALVSGQRNVRPVRERLRGLEDSLSIAGLAHDERLVALGSFAGDFARQQTHALLDAADPPTAILTGGAQVTVGVLKALAERQITAGRDIGLVALDELDLLEIVQPAISVVSRDPHRMGAEAARLLLDAAAGQPPQTVLLPTTYSPRSTPRIN
ncbi:MAG TPA: LacI family DNA-binding transcriptional regulator [Desertimonas sp.]|nr:LacI family DNA-binding transcriptional regulator [Desertimonas sp.]